MTDIEIARKCKLKKITEVAAKIGIDESRLELYGNYKAKVTAKPSPKSNAKLVLVTAINPTSAGEGKTTVSIGLARTVAGAGVRHKGRRNGRRLFADTAYGRYQPALYGRFSRHNRRKQSAVRHAGQQRISGQQA